MASQLSPQATCSPQTETVAPTRRSASRLWVRVAGLAVGLSLASCGSAIATASQGGGSTPLSARARRFEQQIRSLETRGYVQDVCTPNGTAMYNPSTHRIVTVKL
jgi:hypothetical protein